MQFGYKDYDKPEEVGYQGYYTIGDYTLFRTKEDELVVFKGTENTGVVLR